MALLTEFLLRLSFGLAAGMAIVPPRLVTSGYYRNHLYVTLGLSAARAGAAESRGGARGVLVGGGGVGAQLRRVGLLALRETAHGRHVAGRGSAGGDHRPLPDQWIVEPGTCRKCRSSRITVGIARCLADATVDHVWLAAGHDDGRDVAGARGISTPPGWRLRVAAATHRDGGGCRACRRLSAASVSRSRRRTPRLSTQDWLFLLLRWSFGLVGVVILIVLTWKTLEIPNTQSADRHSLRRRDGRLCRRNDVVATVCRVGFPRIMAVCPIRRGGGPSALSHCG